MKTEEKIKKEQDQRIKEWSEVVKENYDWDYAYLLDIIIYKLERMKKCFNDNTFCEENKISFEQISSVINLLKRVREDNYYEEITKELNEKYGEIEFNFNLMDENSYLITRKNETKENREQMKEELHNAWKKSEELKNNDLKEAFKMIQENIFGWWD